MELSRAIQGPHSQLQPVLRQSPDPCGTRNWINTQSSHYEEEIWDESLHRVCDQGGKKCATWPWALIVFTMWWDPQTIKFVRSPEEKREGVKRMGLTLFMSGPQEPQGKKRPFGPDKPHNSLRHAHVD